MNDIINTLKKQKMFASYGSATKEQILLSESILSTVFSEDYKLYLEEFGCADYYGHELTGICDFERLNVVNVTIEERNLNPSVPDNWYVIEQANIDGIVIWQSSTGEIYLTVPNTEPKKICNSLGEYIIL